MNRRFGALVALGFLASLWALFQWGELVAARAGATPFCALGGNFDCAAVWDSPFARAVHSMTHVPVAGWGLMWGVIAFLLPLAVLVEPGKLDHGLSAGLRLTAIAGVVSVGGLAAASIVAGAVCIGCIGTYLVVLTWSALAWLSTRDAGFKEAPRGVMWAGGLALLSYAALFVPGTRTPHAMEDAGRDAMRASAAGSADAGAAPAAGDAQAPQKNDRFDGPGTGDAGRDDQLARFVASLDGDTRQLMSDLLAELEGEAPAQPLPAPRAVVGPANAAVKIVDFTDPLCGHCAALHAVLEEVRQYAPDFAVEPHFFPLDGTCNPSVERKWDTDIRCQAVRAQLCLESDPNKLAAAQKAIFENQQGLTSEKLWELLKPFGDKKKLEQCMASPETQKKLDADINSAMALKLEGTPLVVLNGKEVKPYPPLLFALILTHGATKHPAFTALPPPRPRPTAPGP